MECFKIYLKSVLVFQKREKSKLDEYFVHESISTPAPPRQYLIIKKCE